MAADKVEKAWDGQAVFLFDDGDRYYCPSVLYKDAVAFFNTWTAPAAKYEMEAKIEEARASCVLRTAATQHANAAFRHAVAARRSRHATSLVREGCGHATRHAVPARTRSRVPSTRVL